MIYSCRGLEVHQAMEEEEAEDEPDPPPGIPMLNSCQTMIVRHTCGAIQDSLPKILCHSYRESKSKILSLARRSPISTLYYLSLSPKSPIPSPLRASI